MSVCAKITITILQSFFINNTKVFRNVLVLFLNPPKSSEMFARVLFRETCETS